MLYKMSKVQKQILLVKALLAWVTCYKSKYVSYFSNRFWLSVTVYMLRHLYAQYCPGQNHILMSVKFLFQL